MHSVPVVTKQNLFSCAFVVSSGTQFTHDHFSSWKNTLLIRSWHSLSKIDSSEEWYRFEFIPANFSKPLINIDMLTQREQVSSIQHCHFVFYEALTRDWSKDHLDLRAVVSQQQANQCRILAIFAESNQLHHDSEIPGREINCITLLRVTFLMLLPT